MNNSCPEHTLVSPYLPPPQPPLELDALGSNQEHPSDGDQLDPRPVYNTPWFESFDVYVTQPQAQSAPTQVTAPETYPPTPGTLERIITTPFSSLRTLPCYVRTNFSDSPLSFAETIRRAITTFSRVAFNTPCVSWIRVLITRAAHIFIRVSEYVAEGINMYNEMCYEGLEYLIRLQEHIEESIRYMEETRDRDV